MQIDVTINVTLDVDDDTWYETLEAFDGDEDDALFELVSDLESSTLDSMYGEAWVCSADNSGIINKPGKDTRFK
jgi:hypothetical protein